MLTTHAFNLWTLPIYIIFIVGTKVMIVEYQMLKPKSMFIHSGVRFSRATMRMSFIGQVCLHIQGICYSDRSSTVQQNDSDRTGPEHVSGAERWEFPLHCSISLPAHLQFHPAPVKSLHARSNLKFLCMPNTCRFWRVLRSNAHNRLKLAAKPQQK